MNIEMKDFDSTRTQGSLTSSELIYILSCIKEKYGDIEVYTSDCGYEASIKGITFSYMNGKDCVVLGVVG